MLTLIIIKQFEEIYQIEYNPLVFFHENVEHFQKKWAEFTKYKTQKEINAKKIIGFLRLLNYPLGFQICIKLLIKILFINKNKNS